MSPHELRFEIFKKASDLVNYQYEQKNYEYNLNLDRYYDNKGPAPDPNDKPSVPTFEEILETANKINNFVSENK